MIYTQTTTLWQNLRLYLSNFKRRGLVSTLRHYAITTFFPLYKILVRPGHFIFDEKTYNYFFASYGATWSNERAVEIPIFMTYLKNALQKKQKVLEVGCVLDHYVSNEGSWRVLDKYEIFPGVVNEDIVDFRPNQVFDTILSVSTMEHIGFDELVPDPNKLLVSIKRQFKMKCTT